MWVHPAGKERTLDATLVWGRNRVERRDLDSWLLEGEWSGERALTPFIRLEQVRKDAEEQRSRLPTLFI